MAFDFPNAPTIGQTANGYVWDGEKWAALGSPSAPVMRTDALGWSGMQINGSMEVSQERGVTPISTNGYVCDGWYVAKSGTMVMAASQAVPSFTPGFNNFGAVVISTAQASLGAGDYLVILQSIEGYRIARLAWGTANAQPITIGFWTGHARPGLYSVTVRNGTDTRGYVTTYTQNVASAAEYKTITIPGCTDGTWLTTNNLGMSLVFTMASGTTWTAPTANVWNAGGFFAAPGQVNGVAATTDFFRLTGVVVLPGIDAPTAAQSPLIMRPYDQELITCKRYYQKIINPPGTAIGNGSSTIYYWSFPFPVEMRATPTASMSATISFGGAAGNYTATAILNNLCTYQTWQANMTMSGAVPTAPVNALSSGIIYADARL